MSLESADSHNFNVLRERFESWENSLKSALFLVFDVVIFYLAISCALTGRFLIIITCYC